ncbi:TPA: multidrug efflux transcriptional repressor AdeL [Acinetobacter baumannii]|uniref:HTH-type transcriptional regulator DmlR n=14 Tax=Acinetobacter baumannii TaxID=470 RepID=A0ABX6CIW7_ACIB2|nr:MULTISPECIES: multidrug efflux transcriptional repressor AdeL [Acinetobacter]ADX93118.1 transcriptional regulator [Acinetobacter baumannii TCDC-AB0715]AHX27777.1 transcriptional regulator [Acinetobacter baumannii AC12]AHX64968.1 transcriptional regulator [Acinetobacter baumannii AC30]EMT93558.1 LysR family transcriptional regulator [Acinetobacter baumannii ABNIH5]EXB16408.1 bacterial regulatory helix-turn-helix, lysR family protein [Acinetobacter baumannii 1397084]EXB51494.1 bacterial regu
MDLFHAMRVFNKVVETNSFSLAADSLGLPRASVTTTIQALEKHLQVRLLNRTTRKISLTPDGAVYYDRTARILADVADIESSFHDAERGPRGQLRIDVPVSIGRLILIPRLRDFHARYPDIDLVIGLNDRPVDLVGEAVDCAIRVGELKDSSLIARRIGTFQCATAASPIYLEKYGEPTSIEDLQKNHKAIHFFSSRTGRNFDWDFVVDDLIKSVSVRGRVSVNDGDAYIDLALQGFGIIQGPRYMLTNHLESGLLKEVLPQWTPAPMPISAVYLQNRHLSLKVKVFVDWVAELFAGCPLLGGTALPFDQKCEFACDKETGHEYTIRTLVEQHNIAEAYTLKT